MLGRGDETDQGIDAHDDLDRVGHFYGAAQPYIKYLARKKGGNNDESHEQIGDLFHSFDRTFDPVELFPDIGIRECRPVSGRYDPIDHDGDGEIFVSDIINSDIFGTEKLYQNDIRG